MKPLAPNQPLPLQSAAELLPPEFRLLMNAIDSETDSEAMITTSEQGLRDRLMARVRAADRAETDMHAVRLRSASGEPWASGVTVQVLHVASLPEGPRPGEPLRVLLVGMQPGAVFDADVLFGSATGLRREWLMVQGELFLDDLLLQPGDYQLAPSGSGHRSVQTDTGALTYAHGDIELSFVA